MLILAVIPGRDDVANPESRDGLHALHIEILGAQLRT